MDPYPYQVPDSMGSRDPYPDPDSQSGSGSRALPEAAPYLSYGTR
jgi:hypothetical protein